MAELSIALMGSDVLSGIAATVEDPTAIEISVLAKDMIDTMLGVPEIGIAAPQVFRPLRIVTYHIPEEVSEQRGGGPVNMTTLVNPVLTPLEEAQDHAWETCLSLPGLTGLVPRYCRVGLTAVDLAGHKLEFEASDFCARVLQHECDHLDGILYPMRMTDMSKFGFGEAFADKI